MLCLLDTSRRSFIVSCCAMLMLLSGVGEPMRPVGMSARGCCRHRAGVEGTVRTPGGGVVLLRCRKVGISDNMREAKKANSIRTLDFAEMVGFCAHYSFSSNATCKLHVKQCVSVFFNGLSKQKGPMRIEVSIILQNSMAGWSASCVTPEHQTAGDIQASQEKAEKVETPEHISNSSSCFWFNMVEPTARGPPDRLTIGIVAVAPGYLERTQVINYSLKVLNDKVCCYMMDC